MLLSRYQWCTGIFPNSSLLSVCIVHFCLLIVSQKSWATFRSWEELGSSWRKRYGACVPACMCVECMINLYVYYLLVLINFKKWKSQQIWLLELLKFQRILLYTVLFVLPIVLTASSPHFDHSCKVCNIMTVIKSLKNNQKKRKFHNLFIQCKTYPNSWKFSWILGYRPCFYTACVLFTFKCHNRDCYHNRDMLSSRIVICQNSHNRSGLLAPYTFEHAYSSLPNSELHYCSFVSEVLRNEFHLPSSC